MTTITSPIGVFDSGYGGLTVLREIKKKLPQYDYVYLGDNARAPYGTRSFETVYQYTKQCVQWLFQQGCPLVILACNTASAKALRNIQQNDLAQIGADKRVLGVIRPTAETLGTYSKSGHIGILATQGTVQSKSYELEVAKYFPEVKLFQKACPLLVPLIENNEFDTLGAQYFIEKYVQDLMHHSDAIDTVLLGCTHYPLILNQIKAVLPPGVNVISQGNIVANSLQNYLSRHETMEGRLSKNGAMKFYTTDSTEDFDRHSAIFFGEEVHSCHLDLSLCEK